MSAEIRVPAMGESIVDAVVAKWNKQVGEQVNKDEVLVELETDKVNVEVTASESGVLQQIARQTGETVAVGDVLGMIGSGAIATTPPSNGATKPAQPFPVPQEVPVVPSEVTATPLARKVAAEHQVDLAQVKTEGSKIKKEDVLQYVEQQVGPEKVTQPLPADAPLPPAPPPAPVVRPAIPPAPPRPVSPTTPNLREERQKLSRRRQTIASRLVEAQHTAAMLTTFNEVDLSAVNALRARRKDAFKEQHGVSLGYMSFFTKASVGALKAFPRLNAEIQGDEIVLKKYYDIGVAVGAEEGLVVPVVREADRKSFAQIEKEIGDLAKKARNNTLSLADLQGGTFTITNGGVFGSLLSTPILNYPQVGILGMHKIQPRPVAVGDQVVVRPMMYLALTYDHRIVDGREAVQFLVKIKELLEDPEILLLEG